MCMDLRVGDDESEEKWIVLYWKIINETERET